MPVGRRPMAALALLLSLVFVASGCGGGKKGGGVARGGHEYIVKVPRQKGAPAGIYVTVISPVPLSQRLLTRKGARLVARAKGPQACSATKTVHGGKGQTATLNGKKLTFKINGSGPLLSVICEILKKGTVNLPLIAGG